LFQFFPDLIISEIKDNSDHADFDTLTLQSVGLKKRLIEENSMTYENLHLPCDHLIHGDYLYHNVFFGPDERVSYVFDLEKADYSPRMFEVFRSLVISFLSKDISKRDIKKAKLYLDSYLNVYPASKDELSRGLQLFYLTAIHGTWVESEHYVMHNNRVDGFLGDDFLRIKYLSEHFEEFEKELLG